MDEPWGDEDDFQPPQRQQRQRQRPPDQQRPRRPDQQRQRQPDQQYIDRRGDQRRTPGQDQRQQQTFGRRNDRFEEPTRYSREVILVLKVLKNISDLNCTMHKKVLYFI